MGARGNFNSSPKKDGCRSSQRQKRRPCGGRYRIGVVCFGDGGRVRKPRKTGGHQKLKEVRKYTVLPEPPEAMSPADTLTLASETNITRDSQTESLRLNPLAYLFYLASVAF